MAIEKYIIDKSDLTSLLRGEILAIHPKGNIKGFCVEIAGNLTNGDVINALFPNIRIIDMPDVEVVQVVNEENDIFWGESRNFHYTWWNSPYKECEKE